MEDELSMIILTSPPLLAPICLGANITFTCHITNNFKQPLQYQWSTDGVNPQFSPEVNPKIGDRNDSKYTIQIPSQPFIVTCEAFARQNGGKALQCGRKSITIQHIGEPCTIVRRKA